MGYPFLQSFTTTGAKTPCIVDWTLVPFNVSALAVLVSGTATFGVEYTLDNVNDSSQTSRWISSPNLPTGTTSTGLQTFDFPVLAIRMNIASIGGTLEFKVVQGLPL